MSEAAAPVIETGDAPAAPSTSLPADAPAPSTVETELAAANPPPEPEAPADFTEQVPEGELRGWLQNKGFKSLEDWAESNRSLEQHMRAGPDKLLRMPDPDAGDEVWQELYGKLGRPETAEGYELAGEVGEGMVDLSPKLREWAHAQGLSQKQAAGIYEAYNAEMTAMVAADVEKSRAQADADILQLKTEYGPAYQQNLVAAQRFLNRFEVSDEVRTSMELAMGTKAFVEMAVKIGRGLGEHAGPGDELQDSGVGDPLGMTPGRASAKKAELLADPKFREGYLSSKDSAENQRIRKLNAIIAGERPTA